MSSGYILGIARGHNAGVCLLKDGEIVFAIEEERLTRTKYDGGPYASMLKVLEYTDKVDYIFVSHTQSLADTAGKVDYTGDDVYTGLARKLGLIKQTHVNLHDHPQVIDLSNQHHKIHAACAFYRSGFDEAVAVVVDGAGSVTSALVDDEPIATWEVETLMDCDYPAEFKTLYKHSATRSPVPTIIEKDFPAKSIGEGDNTFYHILSNNAGIVKAYEAVTEYCGFQGIEAGKTMGLFPYGFSHSRMPTLFNREYNHGLADRNMFIPMYPAGAMVNSQIIECLNEEELEEGKDVTELKSRRCLAYAVQVQSQEKVLEHILAAVNFSGKKKVVLTGGYGLNCVANYYYLEVLNKEGIELYVEPISNDGGTAIGVAMWGYYQLHNDSKVRHSREIYLGPAYSYDNQEIESIVSKHGGVIQDSDDSQVVELMTNKHIVACFQGRSENGPRALGNRSLLFDPRFEDGKDFVNEIKKREYFRPFAGSILHEDVHDWFDLRGMDESPHMMYAVHCKEGVAEKIPSIIHVDGSCRIQTVKEQDNPLYYRLISEFKKQTGTPIVFNTSFNLGGEPLVETLDDAVRTLKDSKIEYLYLPEYGKLITVSNWEEV